MKLNVLFVATLLAILPCLQRGGEGELFAQDPSVYRMEFALAKPIAYAPKNVTPKSFEASWRNIRSGETENQYRLIVTREFEAQKDGTYAVANAVIKGTGEAGKDVRLEMEDWLDKYVSQPAWVGYNTVATPKGIKIDGANFNGDNAIFSIRNRITSPVMFLRNDGGKFKVKFRAKVAQGTAPAKLNVFAYGELTQQANQVPPSVLKEIPADGQEHDMEAEFYGGTWCHMITIELTNKVSVEFVGAIVVEQQLKKGDKGYRSTMPGLFSEGQTTKTTNAEGKTVFSAPINELTEGQLDLEAAKKEGERVAYRLCYQHTLSGASGTIFIYRSMYSDPVYFDQSPTAKEYLYLGYAGYEDPDYNSALPGGSTMPVTFGAAIKLPTEKTKDLKGNKVVGLRLCVGASLQLCQGNWFNPVPWDTQVPYVFVAEHLKIREQDGQPEDKPTQYAVKKSTSLADGWNVVMFDEPYVIGDKDFNVGYWVYDQCNQARVMVTAKYENKDPNSSIYSVKEMQGDDALNPWTPQLFAKQPLLIQAIVEVSEDSEIMNKGEFSDLSGEPIYYSKEDVAVMATLKNSGVAPIRKIEINAGFAGNEQLRTIDLATPLAGGESIKLKVSGISVPAITGDASIKVSLLKVNDKTLKSPSVVSFATKLVDINKVYPRTPLVEIFTTELCNNCPEADTRFMMLMSKNSEFEKRTAVVMHHEGLGPDFLTMAYTKRLLPMFGSYDRSGDINRYAFSPGFMVNRMPNPYVDTKEANVPVGSLPTIETRFLNVMSNATYRQPAYGRLSVKSRFDEAAGKLVLDIEGQLSDARDMSRPVYLTIMLTQDDIKSREQLGVSSFIHQQVLRYVDEKGLEGIVVTPDEQGKFTYKKEIVIATTPAQGKPKDNTILLENKKGEAIQLAEAMKKVHAVAFLHHYADLPNDDELLVNDDRVRGNEVINAAADNITAPVDIFPVGVYYPQAESQVKIYLENNNVCVNAPTTEIRVFAIDGNLVPATNLLPGIYVVRALLTDGTAVTGKVLVRN